MMDRQQAAGDVSEGCGQQPPSAPAQKLETLGRLTAGIAHDFNNLIAMILGSCDLALGEIHPGTPGHDDLASARAAALRARELVRQLLVFVRQEPLHAVPLLRLDRAIDELLPLLRPLVGGAITLDVQHAEPLPPVRIDPGQFDQVIINLAVNARDAMPQGGRLSLRTAVVGGTAAGGHCGAAGPAAASVQVEVADTGSGIPREIIGEIFAPFFTTKPAGRGTGLGLALVHTIVGQSGGRIEVDSSAAVGTTFRIRLPAAAGAADLAAEPAPPAAPLPETAGRMPPGGARVLLVEDEMAIRSFAARALRSRGWSVAEADDGASALQALSRPERPFDLLLTDLKLPDMPGTDVIRQARLRRPELPVLVISGELTTAEALDPADHRLSLLAKPFTLAELVARVQRLLEG